ncbi:2-oxoglutarate dehydrogenase E1 component [Mechercharimyces sp. CAU 1602]|uniref:2-oxoglutarate dehydrogenase E1 component n=1 Tax=Mechercharimyces sp. CAU 1602 TaxID=2973933 RepID=UPI002161DEA9|nr:2-oxoglutarate dehydrogenase E1 component [Mechercharimyces sp. CAU 1602]MCS1351650.1 2-oxoglutarate dehydrogenase E1 component [Mechercharimyces sp. CAU 1602]
MATGKSGTRTPWEQFFGPNLGYIIEQYDKYSDEPSSVDEDLKELFQQWGPPSMAQADSGPAAVETAHSSVELSKVVQAEKMAQNIRTYGHLAAEIDPLQSRNDGNHRMLEPEMYGLKEQDLSQIPARVIWPEAPADVHTGQDVMKRLKEVYTKSLAYEFSHVYDLEEHQWLTKVVESGEITSKFPKEKRVAAWERLLQVEGFEQFLHKTFVGQKRFSVEGIDALVPSLDEMISQSVHLGVRNVMIGMAHRGRLNVLAHVLGKPYEAIFSEFHHAPNKELVPSEGSMGINYGWTGDVKYHLGADRQLEESDTVQAQVSLANNPSHLEYVGAVVEGCARAAQEERGQRGYAKQDVTKAMAILIHGDAAFPGEGIVAETLNLSQLPGYQTGGSIHIIANNRIGFTTESGDARSTKYASDLAKGFEIPIVHVNADDLDAVLAAVRLACEYRARFNKDFVIDLIGYRRYGHNEMDDPSATQPIVYEKIKNHPTVRHLYREKLESEGILTSEFVKTKEKEIQEELQAAFQKMKEEKKDEVKRSHSKLKPLSRRLPKVKTEVSGKLLRELNADLLQPPQNFTVYPKVERVLKRRADALSKESKVDWALAETLAFASILGDGTPIRITGQDCERATFAHRHLVLHDAKTGGTYSPLHVLPQAKSSFTIFNSPLSEASVLGFEYGYNVQEPNTMVLWEAQYGDFANAGQVIFDQFISAGRAKWDQQSSLVMLLPHGYEGQGPEHSSARMERYLQSAAENNWIVANMTKASQYFHILRRQAAITGTEEARPLVIMSPKSLIRNKRVISDLREFEKGSFQPIWEQEGLGEKRSKVKRLVLCSGKIAVDLETELEAMDEKPEWLHIVRVEQLYPFPQEELQAVLDRFKQLKEIVWVQEEPANMGAWSYIEPRLREIAPGKMDIDYIGRQERSSTAEGLPDMHNVEQQRILSSVFRTN